MSNLEADAKYPSHRYSMFLHCAHSSVFELAFDDVDTAYGHARAIAAWQFDHHAKAESKINLLRVAHMEIVDDVGTWQQFVLNNVLHVSVVDWTKFHSWRHAASVRLKNLCDEVERTVEVRNPIGMHHGGMGA